MKSTLKRKLIVRETVRRETHGISNTLSRFRRMVRSTFSVRIRMDCWFQSLCSTCRISRQCASTGVGSGLYASQEGGWLRLVLQLVMCQFASDRGVAAHALGLASASSVQREHGGLRAVRLNYVVLSVARMHTMCSGCWRSYGFMRPVLKHGPRSLTCVRVLG